MEMDTQLSISNYTYYWRYHRVFVDKFNFSTGDASL